MINTFSFVHPDELPLHETKHPHGHYIYVHCPSCDGTMLFNIAQRDGSCFSCHSVVKLHKMYKTMSDEEIAEQFDVRIPSYRLNGTRAPETIIPGPLSQYALQYIASRGISTQTLAVLPVLQETTYYGMQWLCWRNVAGFYELRSIGGSEKRTPYGNTKTYSHAAIRQGGKLVICEGIFSTLSYAQLFGYEPDIYITLNSASVVPRVVNDFPEWVSLGVEEITLALDFDAEGRRATRALFHAIKEKIAVHIAPPLLPKCDWNDQLMEVLQ